jgi:hypothetical protein
MVGQPLVAKASWFAVIHLTKTVSRQWASKLLGKAMICHYLQEDNFLEIDVASSAVA